MGEKLSVVLYIPICLHIDSLIIYFSRIKSLWSIVDGHEHFYILSTHVYMYYEN